MQVALGMVYLHSMEQPLLHLDLKSANVLLDKNRTAKVCGFSTRIGRPGRHASAKIAADCRRLPPRV